MHFFIMPLSLIEVQTTKQPQDCFILLAAFFLSLVSRHKPPALRCPVAVHLPVPRRIIDIQSLGGNLNNVGEHGNDDTTFLV